MIMLSICTEIGFEHHVVVREPVQTIRITTNGPGKSSPAEKKIHIGLLIRNQC